jgi:hypothetical protein
MRWHNASRTPATPDAGRSAFTTALSGSPTTRLTAMTGTATAAVNGRMGTAIMTARIGHLVTVRESTRRYLSIPRQCIDCGGVPSAARPRCETCHDLFIQTRHEGRET